ncbi:FAD dependent oxidoreductase superfamily [Penicillium chermesinum]|nr:FAD dependent oxidoreductase superfamily [Penicillium chermesinum]
MPEELRRRHNGQPQACEPCRKAKVRCDHATPKCSRCITRNLNCSYHPAPMTKRRALSTRGPTPLGTSTMAELLTIVVTPAHFERPSETAAQARAPSVPLADPGSTGTSAASATSGGPKRNTLFRKKAGQHETTRYSAVFSENQDSFGPAITDTAISHESPYRDNESTAWPRMELALSTLLHFPTARTCDMLVTGLHHIHDVWVSPTMIQSCLEQVWTEYADCLGESRTRESLMRMAKDLFLNDESSPPSGNHESEDIFNPPGWMNWFGGPSLRWEMLGILFSWAGMAFKHKQEWDPVFDLPEQQGRNRHTAADKMRECAAACVKLSEDYFEISDTMVICLKNSTKLQSMIISDESDRTRVDYGTVRSAFIAAGLHRLPAFKEVTPLSQHRSSLASSMYYLDKCESLYNARPPMLSRHYCQCPLPLDLSEEDIYGGRERLAAACAKLDSNGWGTDGRIFTTTWIRALAMLSPIRESILELSLGVHSQFTKCQIGNVIAQLREIVASYPAHIRYHQDSGLSSQPALDLKKRSASDRYIITRIHLDVLQCHFLLQRLLVSRGLSGGQALFDIAQETIITILSLWSDRDRLQDYHHAFDWIFVSNGMPSAGILCIELLRASNLAPPVSTTKPSTPTEATFAPVRLSRSEVMQNLSMFKALLDWIRPTDNNAQLSDKFKKVLQRIIDSVFEALSPVHAAPVSQSTSEPPTQEPRELHGDSIGLESPYTKGASHDDLDFAMTTIDDMDWLNTPVENATLPFWHRDIDELHDHRTTKDLPASSDVVIIGAGYAGISTAYHLVKNEDSREDLSVTIIEARGVCSGATGRNGGHVRPDMYSPMPKLIERGGIERALEVTEFEIAHIHAIKYVVEKEKIDCDFTLSRSIDVWCNEDAALKAKELYDTLAARNLEYMKDVFFVLGKEAEGISGVKGAKACASFTAGTIWPYKFILHLTKLILATGSVNLQTNTPVTSVMRQANGFLISTARGTTFARKVVYANNAYVAGLLPQYCKAIVPCRGLCTHISTLEGTRAPLLSNSYVVREKDNTLSYLAPRSDGSIVVGGANSRYRPFPNQWYNTVDDSTLISEVEHHYDNFMQRNFHGWENSGARVDKIWTGVMGYSWDSLPHDTYILAGFNGHGMPVVFLSALGIARMIKNGVSFEDSGVPKLFETTSTRLEKINNGPPGGDIITTNG